MLLLQCFIQNPSKKLISIILSYKSCKAGCHCMDIITYAAVSGLLLLPGLWVCFFLYLHCKPLRTETIFDLCF